MNDQRQQMFNQYMTYLYNTGKSYSYIGKYIKYVRDFLDNDTFPINKAGYRAYIKNNSHKIVGDPLISNAIRDFLDFRGIGYSRKKKESDIGMALEKLSAISEKNRKLMNEFIDYLSQEEDYSSNTLRVYYDSIKKFFEYSNEITSDNCRRFIKTMEDKGMKPSTIRLRITAIERLSKFIKSPVVIKRPKFQRTLNTENVPNESEYNKLLSYLYSQSNKDRYFWVKILATTGARISEFIQFKWEDILSGEVTLKGKGNKYRRFFFSKSLQKEVREYVRETSKTGLIAVGRFGPVTTRGIAQLMKEWALRCGIPKEKIHPHAFRHFFAKMFLKKNNDVIHLADILGHGSIDTTRIYLQKSYEEQKREFDKSVTW